MKSFGHNFVLLLLIDFAKSDNNCDGLVDSLQDIKENLTICNAEFTQKENEQAALLSLMDLENGKFCYLKNKNISKIFLNIHSSMYRNVGLD